MTINRRYHLLAGTLGPDCPTSLALGEFNVFDPSRGEDYWYPTRRAQVRELPGGRRDPKEQR